MCCPTSLPFVREVTLMLLSQCPPLKSSFASWDTANNLEVISSPGAKGPLTLRCVLQANDEQLEGSFSSDQCILQFLYP